MKAMVCELCGSNDIVKQDDYFVCQHCGTKYTLEEAKKLLGTVKIDTSEELENLFELARRARETNDSESAAKYYDSILVKVPSSWEATFYSTFYKAASCKIMNIASAANSVANVLPAVFKLINEKEDKNKVENAVCEVISQTKNINWLLYSAAFNHYKKHEKADNSMQEFVDRRYACFMSVMSFSVAWKPIDESVKKSNTVVFHATSACETAQKMIVDSYNYFYNQNAGLATQHLYESHSKTIDSVEEIIQGFNPSHKKPSLKKYEVPASTTRESSKSSGCYVATAVYGSYDCPEVWTLRRYRDYTLAETWYGRAFIHTYYAISPTLVKWFGNTEWFRKMCKPTLDRMVAKLNRKGVAGSPYKDRNW